MQVTKSGRLHFQSPGNQPPVQNQQQQQYRVPCSNATDGKENKGQLEWNSWSFVTILYLLVI